MYGYSFIFKNHIFISTRLLQHSIVAVGMSDSGRQRRISHHASEYSTLTMCGAIMTLAVRPLRAKYLSFNVIHAYEFTLTRTRVYVKVNIKTVFYNRAPRLPSGSCCMTLSPLRLSNVAQWHCHRVLGGWGQRAPRRSRIDL